MVLPGWLDHQTIFCAGSTPSQSVASCSVRAVSPPTAGPPPQAAKNPVAAAAPPRARMLRREGCQTSLDRGVHSGERRRDADDIEWFSFIELDRVLRVGEGSGLCGTRGGQVGIWINRVGVRVRSGRGRADQAAGRTR